MDKNQSKFKLILFILIFIIILFGIFPNLLIKNKQISGYDVSKSYEQASEDSSEADDIPDNEKDDKNDDIYSRDDKDAFYPMISQYLAELKKLPQEKLSEDYIKDNYIANAATSDGKLHAFKKKTIRIYVPKNRYYKLVHRAFVAYNYQFKGYLLFMETDNPNKTDIKISFVDELSDITDNKRAVGIGGVKKYDSDGNILYSELMVLNKRNENDNPEFIYVYNTLIHEIGHCIGIAGHSPNSDDIMYKNHSIDSQIKLSKFSKRDIETIKLLYSNNPKLLSKLLRNAKEIKLNENIQYAMQHNSSDSYLKVANSYYNLGKYDEAKEVYQKAIEMNPDNPRVYYNMGYFYHDIGKYDEAIDMYKKAIETGKVDSDIYNALAYSYRKIDKFEESINTYKQSIEINNNNYSAYANSAECYLRLNMYDDAVMYAKQAIKYAKSNDEKILAYDIAGYSYAQKKDYVSAMSYYKTELEMNPKDKNTFINYISMCLNARKKDDAKIAYKSYIENFNSDEFNDNEKEMLKTLK